MQVDSRYINKHFLVRYYPESSNTTYNRLVGLPKLKTILQDEELYEKMLDKAVETMKQKVDFRLRRGIRITIVCR